MLLLSCFVVVTIFVAAVVAVDIYVVAGATSVVFDIDLLMFIFTNVVVGIDLSLFVVEVALASVVVSPLLFFILMSFLAVLLLGLILFN